MTRTEKLEEETFVDGFLVTGHAKKDDADVPPPKKRVKITASPKTCAPRDASPEKVPRARDGADRDDDSGGYEDEAPPRAAPSLLASFDAAAASSSEDEEEEETSGQWPKSQYHGVTTTGNSSKNPWRATTRIRGKPVNLGSHATEEEAARAYDKYLRSTILLALIIAES
ncbi:hypothetical protein JL722_9739 [Aureococcus anophagefferens]|nr:hypothetical protein JL722_9739 [Aureococcus anophagefferens]